MAESRTEHLRHCDDNSVGHDESMCRTKGVTVKFNPFAFTIEQNNEFIAKGYEPIINFDPRMG